MDDFQPDKQDDFQADDFTPDNSTQSQDVKGTISKIVRPLFEGGGMVAGAAIGAPLAPVTAGVAPVAGGALGYGIGKSAADLTDRYLGVKPLLKNVPEAVKEAEQNALQGAESEAINMAAGPVVKKIFNNPITRGIGKSVAGLGQWATNIPSKDYKTIFNNPEGMLPGSLKRAGEQFAKASREAGIPEELTPEQLQNAIGPKARRIVGQVYAKVFAGEPVTAAEAQNAKQMLDSVYPNPTAKNGRLLHALDTVRNAFQEVISNESPALKEANTAYSIGKAGSKFKTIFPKTLTSRPEFIRTGLLGTLALKNPVLAAFLSPIGQGTITAGAGALKKGIETVASNPSLMAPISSEIVDSLKLNKEDSKSRDKAREFLDQANGDKDLARKLARKAGYTW